MKPVDKRMGLILLCYMKSHEVHRIAEWTIGFGNPGNPGNPGLRKAPKGSRDDVPSKIHPLSVKSYGLREVPFLVNVCARCSEEIWLIIQNPRQSEVSDR